jgi:hypothetical protein
MGMSRRAMISTLPTVTRSLDIEGLLGESGVGVS